MPPSPLHSLRLDPSQECVSRLLQLCESKNAYQSSISIFNDLDTYGCKALTVIHFDMVKTTCNKALIEGYGDQKTIREFLLKFPLPKLTQIIESSLTPTPQPTTTTPIPPITPPIPRTTTMSINSLSCVEEASHSVIPIQNAFSPSTSLLPQPTTQVGSTLSSSSSSSTVNSSSHFPFDRPYWQFDQTNQSQASSETTHPSTHWSREIKRSGGSDGSDGGDIRVSPSSLLSQQGESFGGKEQSWWSSPQFSNHTLPSPNHITNTHGRPPPPPSSSSSSSSSFLFFYSQVIYTV
mmetsp:Transcript_26358/g.34271  ORF Transcript_26358/g.34271 Transcript_26358/m.34271 type:complete len:293 (-) Transcript_26358:3-881(-)